MKKAIKVLIIIHMGLFFFLFYPFFYGFKALEKLDKATSKQELVATGIFSILLISPVVGIMILSMKDKHFPLVEYNSLMTDREKEMLDRTQEPYETRPVRDCHLSNIGTRRALSKPYDENDQ